MKNTGDQFIASKYKVELIETPVGFKYLSDYLDNREALIAGEESGGVGFSFHIPERDGLLASLKIVEHLIKEKKTLRNLRKDLRKTYGDFHYEREDLNVESSIVDSIRKDPEKYINPLCKKFGITKKQIILEDGIKLNLNKDSWVMVRASGTEPVLMVYCESLEKKKVPSIINDFKKTLFK